MKKRAIALFFIMLLALPVMMGLATEVAAAEETGTWQVVWRKPSYFPYTGTTTATFYLYKRSNYNTYTFYDSYKMTRNTSYSFELPVGDYKVYQTEDIEGRPYTEFTVRQGYTAFTPLVRFDMEQITANVRIAKDWPDTSPDTVNLPTNAWDGLYWVVTSEFISSHGYSVGLYYNKPANTNTFGIWAPKEIAEGLAAGGERAHPRISLSTQGDALYETYASSFWCEWNEASKELTLCAFREYHAILSFVDPHESGVGVSGIKFSWKHSQPDGSYVDGLISNSSDKVDLCASYAYKYGTYSVSGFEKDGYGFSPQSLTMNLTRSNWQVSRTVYCSKTGTISLTARDKDNTSTGLKDAVFEVYNSSTNALITTLTTNSSGTASYYLLPGSYYLKEKSPPTDYEATGKRYDFTIEKGMQTRSCTVDYEMGGLLTLQAREKDNTSNLLEGVTYELRNSSTNVLVSTCTTNRSGLADFGRVKFGSYYLQEKTAPINCVPKGAERIAVSITTGGQLVSKTVDYEVLRGQIRLALTDTDDDKLFLPGLTLGIYDQHSTEVDRLVTSYSGVPPSKELMLGNYKVKQISGVSGYTMEKAEYDLALADTDGLDAVIRYGCPATTLDIKVDSVVPPSYDTEMPDPIGEIKVYDENGELVATVPINPEGFTERLTVPPGEYTIEQTTTVPGFYVPEEEKIHKVTVGEDGHYNVKIKVYADAGDIKLICQNEAGRPIGGVKFRLEGTIDATSDVVGLDDQTPWGKAFDYRLFYGSYKVTLDETTLPQGCAVAEASQEFVIDEHGLKELVFSATGDAGELKLEFRSEITDEPFSGIEVALYSDTDEVVEILRSDGDGVLTFQALPLGSYKYQYKCPSGRFEMTDAHEAQHAFSLNVNKEQHYKKILFLPIKGGITFHPYPTNDIDRLGPMRLSLHYKYNDEKVMELEMTGNQDTTVNDLYNTEYYLEVVEAPDDLVLLDGKSNPEFTVKPSEVASGRFAYSFLKGDIILTNVWDDPDSTLLGGVVLEYYIDGVPQPDLTSDDNGIIRLETMSFGEYKFIKRDKAGFEPCDDEIVWVIGRNTLLGELRIVWETERAVLNLKNVDSDELVVEGAVFEVYDIDEDEMIGEITTDAAGKASIRVPPGEVRFTQMSVPTGLIRNQEPVEFLAVTGQEYDKEFINRKVGDDATASGVIQLSARDMETYSTLSGASFGVYAVGRSTKVSTMRTGRNGLATSGELDEGTYYLRELAAPAGYASTATSLPIGVQANKVSEVTVTYRYTGEVLAPTGTLVVTEAGGKSGVTIVIVDAKTGAIAGQATTDSSGVVSFELPEGDYIIKQLVDRDAFILSDGGVKVTVKAGESTYISVSGSGGSESGSGEDNTSSSGSDDKSDSNLPDKEDAQKGTGRLLVVVSDELGEAVAGAGFAVTGSSVSTFSTDAGGQAEIELKPGRYSLRQTKAAAGYLLNTGTWSIEIVDGKISRVLVINKSSTRGEGEDEKGGRGDSESENGGSGGSGSSGSTKSNKLSGGSGGSGSDGVSGGMGAAEESGAGLSADGKSETFIVDGERITIPSTGERVPVAGYAALVMLCLAATLYKTMWRGL